MRRRWRVCSIADEWERLRPRACPGRCRDFARPELFLAGLIYAGLTRANMDVEVLLTAAQLDDWLSRNARRGPLYPQLNK